MTTVRTISLAVVALITATLTLSGCTSGMAGYFEPAAPPLESAELIGTWTSDGAGSIVFGSDHSVVGTDVPKRGWTGQTDDSATPTTRTVSWRLRDNTGNGLKPICLDEGRSSTCMWVIRGGHQHRELDLIVGDPDSVDWYRYRKTPVG
ncbi:hypothetical protein [Curtobacterium sp. ISL-83]|uniref:hypothetical protein n=1 Tax=Curtobacterium sp. ISL-83 TaxID=2819145 RepID=UPI001BE79FAF|nr:hypothetical protein [Curtobacterium sp. ISL-83]MBT2501104.1 hypothetical protein [Curtobacterium sp. ISL-83]